MTIKRIEPVSCARIAGIVYAVLGLIVGAVVSLFALLGTALAGQQEGLSRNGMPQVIGMFVGIGGIVVFPILYGVLGFIAALIGAWIYNLVASKVGGIQIEVA